MDAKSLKRLNRRELLELMVQISEENEALTQENEILKSEIENRKLSAREVGSLAHASLEANNFFVAAENAAKLYLENIMRMEQETQARSERLLEETLEECIRMRARAGFGPDELIPEAWNTPAPAPAAPLNEDTSQDASAAEQAAEAAEATEDVPTEVAQQASEEAPSEAPKKEKRGFFGRKKK